MIIIIKILVKGFIYIFRKSEPCQKVSAHTVADDPIESSFSLSPTGIFEVALRGGSRIFSTSEEGGGVCGF